MALSDPSKLTKHVDDREIQKLVDQYYSLDFEDVISGGIKTRFKVIIIFNFYLKTVTETHYI